MTDTDASRIDGRSARSERTRRAIVAAHLALIDEGDLKPTGERIAERAGVSLRTLWTNFKDMETLFAATGELVTEKQDSLYRAISTELPLTDRVEQFCRQRAEVLEMLAPSARASQLREPFSAQLRKNRAGNIARVRRQLEDVFAPEITMAGASRDQLLNALTVACTWSAWSMMRDELHMSLDEAREGMSRTVAALLVAAIAAAGLR
jgi:TetR/AcrR family transcriptional regulator, regulator of autoinduction and epiphytic fitness